MRSETSADKIRELMELLGRRAKGPGRVYLTGGATAVLLGWRRTTLDVDLKLDPEPAGIFEALREAKEALGINIELAAPDDFIPAIPGWRERSQLIDVCGSVEFLHYDFYGQALAKIERGHTQDVMDVQSMLTSELIEAERLIDLYRQIEPQLDRYPAIDSDAFSAKVSEALQRANRSSEGDESNG